MALIDYWWILLLIALCAFLIKLMDTTLGLGFGTTFTPLLIIFGVSTAIAVPSLLVTEIVAGLVGMLFHTLLRNVRLGQKRAFRRKRRKKRKSKAHSMPNSEHYKTAEIVEKNTTADANKEESSQEEEEIIIEDEEDLIRHEDDEIEEIQLESKTIVQRFRNLTTDTRVILILSGFGILGVIFAAVINVVFEANDYFNFIVKIYIGLMVLTMGILILILRNKNLQFRNRRIVLLGTFGGFNKGISGGGYTPITVMGQLLTGRGGRSALASTTYTKTAVSIAGAIAYVLTHIIVNAKGGIPISWEYLSLAPYLIAGAAVAAPIGAVIAKKAENKWLKIAIGCATIFLGLFTFIRTVLDFTHVWEIKPLIDMTNILMSI
ncbi:MAG: sulfite exporter TauE/SafE family protein [Candidatus Heimdallarchaeota archaeon]